MLAGMEPPVVAHAPRSRHILMVLAVLTLAAACQASQPSFPITDARELLTKTVERAIALDQVHLDVNLAEAGNFLGGPDTATMQMDADLVDAEMSLTATSSEAGAAPVGIVIADGGLFTSSGGAWDEQPLASDDPDSLLARLPDRPTIERALRAIAADDRVAPELGETVDCATGRCYALVVTIPPQVLWDHVGPAWEASGMSDLPATLPPDVPAVSLLFHIDPADLDVVRAELIYGPSSGRVHVVVDASKHDDPMDIVAPIPGP